MQYTFQQMNFELPITITGPAGNTFVAQETTTPLKPQGYHPGVTSWALSIPWVEIHCKPGTSQGIGRYFSTYFDAASGFFGYTPTLVGRDLHDYAVKQITCGYHHNIAVSIGGENIFAWGFGDNAALGTQEQCSCKVVNKEKS